MNNLVKYINDKISYLEANNNPLSADIGVIKDNNVTWLFDVGNGIQNIQELNEEYNVVISHFHLDHLGNIKNIKIKKLYVSKETLKYIPKEVIDKCDVITVTDEIKVDNLRIFNIPSSHAKGSLGLEIDNTYTFLGDATYAKIKNGQLMYNAQILKDEINCLKELKSKYLLISHYKELIRDKEEVINELNLIYQKRENNNPFILIGNE